MLIGFGLLGLLAAWRAKGVGTASILLWGIGVFLATAAFVPKLGRVAYLAVYLPTSIIGYVVSHIIIALMFFFVITPLAVIRRLMGKDLLQRKEKTGWIPVKEVKNKDSYYRQF